MLLVNCKIPDSNRNFAINVMRDRSRPVSFTNFRKAKQAKFN